MPSPERPAVPISLFYSYSHKDEDLRQKLETHLSLLQDEGVISGWHDRCIEAGTEWDGAISRHLEEAGIILLLVSADFLASRYCRDVEVARAMERHEAGAARVIPVILRPVDWHTAPFRKLQALPKDVRPVATWRNRDEAFTDVARGIRDVVASLAAGAQDPPTPARPSPGVPPPPAQASRISDDSTQARLPVAVEDLVLLEVSTKPNPLATLLNVRFGFDHKPLTLTRPLSAPVTCGCTAAHLFFRIEDPFRLGDEPKSQQLPENSEVTYLLLGARPRISLKIRRGTRFLNGTGAMELELLSQPSLEFTLTRSVCTDATIKGSVRLKPEYFQIDWLHDHGSYDELRDLQRDLSIHLTALVHKAQRSRKLNQPILPPEVESDEQ